MRRMLLVLVCDTPLCLVRCLPRDKENICKQEKRFQTKTPAIPINDHNCKTHHLVLIKNALSTKFSLPTFRPLNLWSFTSGRCVSILSNGLKGLDKRVIFYERVILLDSRGTLVY